MGNNLVGRKRLVHPIDEGHKGMRSSRHFRIKVVMTRNQWKKLMAMAAELGLSDDLCRFILQECCHGKLDAHVVTGI